MKLLSKALAASPLPNEAVDFLIGRRSVIPRLPLLPSTAEPVKKKE
jgi:hypothetical protein